MKKLHARTHDPAKRMSRTPGKSKGGSGDARPPKSMPTRMRREPGSSATGKGDSRPPAKGPMRMARTDKGKGSNHGGKGYAV